MRRLDFTKKPVIGMVHLLALPGAPRASHALEGVEAHALADARTLAEEGVDAVLVENYGDAPFAKRVDAGTVAAMTALVRSVRDAVDVPVGVNVLRNDGAAAIAVAAAAGASFVRVNVLSGVMATDQGLVEGCAREVADARRRLGADVAVLGDVFVKHAAPWPGVAFEDACRDTAHPRGVADAIVVTGAATGAAASLSRVQAAREAAGVPVVVGSGVTAETVREALDRADAAIVGTALKRGGRVEAPVDPARVRALVRAARQHG